MSTFLDKVSSETCTSSSSSSSIATPSGQSQAAAAGVDDEQQEADLAEFATLAGEFGMNTVGVDVEVSNTEFVKVVKPAKFAHFHCRSRIPIPLLRKYMYCMQDCAANYTKLGCIYTDVLTNDTAMFITRANLTWMRHTLPIQPSIHPPTHPSIYPSTGAGPNTLPLPELWPDRPLLMREGGVASKSSTDEAPPMQMDASPYAFETSMFRGQVMTRTHRNPKCAEYFAGKRRMSSVVITGQFKHPISFADLVTGQEFCHPVKRPGIIMSRALMAVLKWVVHDFLWLVHD
jgi:hypothetical protein